MMASTVSYARVLVEIAVVAPSFFPQVAGPMTAMLVVSLMLSLAIWFSHDGRQVDMPQQGNPSELRSALVFAGLYAVILIALAVGREELNDRQLYAVAGLSGMTDMDAITLSTARLVTADRLDPSVGWRMILVGKLANLIFKWGIVAFLGHRALLKQISVLFGMSLVVGVAILAFWP